MPVAFVKLQISGTGRSVKHERIRETSTQTGGNGGDAEVYVRQKHTRTFSQFEPMSFSRGLDLPLSFSLKQNPNWSEVLINGRTVVKAFYQIFQVQSWFESSPSATFTNQSLLFLC